MTKSVVDENCRNENSPSVKRVTLNYLESDNKLDVLNHSQKESLYGNSALMQENHNLSKKLQIKENMELVYLDEIEQLKSTITHLKQQENEREHNKNTNKNVDLSLISKWENHAENAEEQIRLLNEEILSLRKREEDLQERLIAAESKYDNNNLSESSVSSSEGHSLLISEVTKLKEELANLETSSHLKQSKLQRQIIEIEEDRNSLQSYVFELERQLKENRSELNDARAQLEAVELQVNSTEKTRGNSVFSEIEDRRIRAEQLVLKQREIINELNLRLHQSETDHKRKLTEAIQKQESRFRDRDTGFIDELIAERSRLMTENAKLIRQVQHLEELQLDQERGAFKMSKAFNLEGNPQEGFIASLENVSIHSSEVNASKIDSTKIEKRRVKILQCNMEKLTKLNDGLHQRLLDSGSIRRKLQIELWHHIDDIKRLANQNEELRKQLDEKCKLEKINHSNLNRMIDHSNNSAETMKPQSQSSSSSLSQTELTALSTELSSTGLTDQFDVENQNPNKFNTSQKSNLKNKFPKLDTNQTEKIQSNKLTQEMSPECKTS